MLNVITLQGRLVRDPVLRRTQSEKLVTSFTIACDRDRKSDGGSDVDFIDCVAWNAIAEFVEKWFSKGMLAIIHGRLTIRDWTDKDGNKRKNAEIIVDNIYFGESKRRAADGDERAQMPTDADAPPQMDNEGLAQLAADYPQNVRFADVDDGDGQLPF